MMAFSYPNLVAEYSAFGTHIGTDYTGILFIMIDRKKFSCQTAENPPVLLS
jgi:hypothetical protein